MLLSAAATAEVLSWVGRLAEGLWCAHLPWEGSADQGFPRCAWPRSPQPLPGEPPGLWALASLFTTTTTAIAAGMGQAGCLGAQGMVSSWVEPGVPCRFAFMSQQFSRTFLARCLAIGMAAGGLPGCCAAEFARVKLSLLGLMSKRIPNLVYGQSFVMQPCVMSHSRNRPFWTELGVPLFLDLLGFFIHRNYFFSHIH